MPELCANELFPKIIENIDDSGAVQTGKTHAIE